MCLLTPLNLPGDGLSGPGAGTCGAFVILHLSWVLMENLCHQQQKMSGVSIVEIFHELQLHIIPVTKKKKKKKAEVLGPVAQPWCSECPFTRMRFSTRQGDRWSAVDLA